jgi:hypothetical protein
MKRPQVQPLTKKQKLEQAKNHTFLLGVRCGVIASTELIKSGWKDFDKLEAEVVSRITGEPVSI